MLRFSLTSYASRTPTCFHGIIGIQNIVTTVTFPSTHPPAVSNPFRNTALNPIWHSSSYVNCTL
ncbi:hypothetical protein CW304_30865 [Bacillus sp. UFRGS-B20]|nr:hypothetical protein CW304_30865 [Bacillus sp. UFRGS-B20]